MSEQVSVEVYSVGKYTGRVPGFVAEMIEPLREPAGFDQEGSTE